VSQAVYGLATGRIRSRRLQLSPAVYRRAFCLGRSRDLPDVSQTCPDACVPVPLGVYYMCNFN